MNSARRVWMAVLVAGACAGVGAADPPLDCFGCCGCPGSPPWQENCGRPQWRGDIPDGIPDQQQCVGDWNRDTWVNPADVASFIVMWFFSANNPANHDGDINCDGATTPADVSLFIQYWYTGVMAGGRCP